VKSRPVRREKSKYFVNGTIRAQQLRVIDADGENVGVISREKALQLAEEAGLDLVQVGVAGEMFIAKIMDFGKFLYEKKKQESRSKKHQKIIQIKELKFRPAIGEQDYKIKLKRAAGFLREGKRVKFTLQFRRGRELTFMAESAPAMFKRIQDDLKDLSLGQLVEEKEQRGRLFWSRIFYVKGK